jgi:DNA-binding NarL/FixJ family response regulator
MIKLLVVNGRPQDSFDTVDWNAFGIEMSFIPVVSLMSTTEMDYDVVLLDEDSSQDHSALIQYLFAVAPACKIMLIIRHSCFKAVAYLQMGVTGLLDAMPASRQLLEIVRLIHQGEYYLDKEIAQLLAMRQIKKTLEPFVVLSSREFDIFCLLAEGCSLQTIAEQLGISSKTVSNCQTQIKLKMGIDNKQQFRQVAKIHGLMSEKSL